MAQQQPAHEIRLGRIKAADLAYVWIWRKSQTKKVVNK
jgi:hypothetical protein